MTLAKQIYQTIQKVFAYFVGSLSSQSIKHSIIVKASRLFYDITLKLLTIREGIFTAIERAVKLTLRCLNKPLLFVSALKISGAVSINLFAEFAKII